MLQLQANEVYIHNIREFDVLNGTKSIKLRHITKLISTVLYVRVNKLKIKNQNQDRTAICGICKTQGR